MRLIVLYFVIFFAMNNDDDINSTQEDVANKKHVLTGMKSKKKGFNLVGALQDCKSFLKDKLSSKNCKGITNGCATRCTCLSFLNRADNDSLAGSVSRYMVGWAALSGKEKNRTLGEIQRCADALVSAGTKEKLYMLPLPQGDDPKALHP